MKAQFQHEAKYMGMSLTMDDKRTENRRDGDFASRWETQHYENKGKEQRPKEFKCSRSNASNWEGNWCKKLARKKVSQSWGVGAIENTQDFWKTLSSIPCMALETPHSSAAIKYLP